MQGQVLNGSEMLLFVLFAAENLSFLGLNKFQCFRSFIVSLETFSLIVEIHCRKY